MILNYDDAILKNFDKTKAKKIYISAKQKLKTGVYFDSGKIYVSKEGEVSGELDTKKIFIKGMHNYYNIMCVLAIIFALGLDISKAADSIYNFKGVEHRLEFVQKINGVEYFNDSKGTNPDSTIKAIDSFKSNIVIILGGYDKKISYYPMLKYAKPKIKAVIAIGATKEKVCEAAHELKYENIFKVENLQDAVKKAKSIAKSGDTVLLSPASASWDMFKNYEERGKEFKYLVNSMIEG